jgi:hypothetical protein
MTQRTPSPHPLTQALWTVIDLVDSLAHNGAPSSVTWTYHQGPRVYSTVGAVQTEPTAHQKLAFQSAKMALEPAVQGLSGPMEVVAALAHGPFQWVVTGEKSGAGFKLHMALQGVVVASGQRSTLHKAAANLVGFLDTLPAHGGAPYAVGGTRLVAADPATALALWAALHQKGAPTPEGTRALLTGPKRPEILRILALDDATVDGACKLS